MMKLKQFSVLLSVATVIGSNLAVTKVVAQEEPSIQFGQAIIAAPGCAIADRLLGEDGRTLSLLFDNFAAENGARKPCHIRVNVTIPSGFHVKNVQFLYQGSTEVPSGTKGTTLSRRYIFNGGAFGIATVPAKTEKFTSSNPLFEVQDDVTVASASCGGKGQFGINAIAQSSLGTSIIVEPDVKIYYDLAPC